MKLGLIIKLTNSGVAEAYSINKSENWSRYADDIRPAINSLSNFDGTGKSVVFAKFLGSNGYLLCIIKARPEGSGRGGDNVAAWIHIPTGCNLTNSETEQLLEKVEFAISASRGIDVDSIKSIFDRDFNSSDVLMPASCNLVSANNKGYALRYYNDGDFNLRELLGPSIAQKPYTLYSGVFFVDKSTGITIQGDVLDFEPQDICTFLPPAPIDGFIPCFLLQDKYQHFDKAIEVPAGTQVTIYWYKKGYTIIKKDFIAEGGPSCPRIALIEPFEYKITIQRKLFYVVDPNGVPVTQFDLRINHQLMEGESMDVPESLYLNGLVISVNARGYAEKRLSGVRPQLDRSLTIQLSKQVYHYEFTIPVYIDGKDVKNDALVTIETHNKLVSSPIKGYTTYDRIQEGGGRINRLELDDDLTSKLKYMLYGVALCLFALLLYEGCSALDNYEFNPGWPPFKEIKHTPNNAVNTANDDLEEVGQMNTDSIYALNYLETNEIWHKDSLDYYAATKGLFDDLNTFNDSALIIRKEGVLIESSKLTAIIEKLSKYKKDGKDPHKGKERNGGNYNSSTDKGIDVNNYLNWLSEEHASIEMFPSNNPAPKEQKSPISGKIRDNKTTITNSKPQNVQPKKGGSRGSVN